MLLKARSTEASLAGCKPSDGCAGMVGAACCCVEQLAQHARQVLQPDSAAFLTDCIRLAFEKRPVGTGSAQCCACKCTHHWRPVAHHSIQHLSCATCCAANLFSTGVLPVSCSRKCLTVLSAPLQNNEVVAALVDLFRQFEVREEKQVAGHHAVVDPTPLREALGNLPDSRFKVGESSGFTSLC